jgi:natural product precursor
MEKSKNQKLNPKLKLNKQVVTVLAQTEMKNIRGGQQIKDVGSWAGCTGRPTSVIPGSFICCEGQE